MNRMIIVISCFICLSLSVSGIALGGGATNAYVHVKNRADEYIDPDKVQIDGSNISRLQTGIYYKYTSEGYHNFSTKESSESKSKQSNVSPPSTKIVTIRFSRN